MSVVPQEYIEELDVTEEFVESLAKMLEICVKNQTDRVNVELDVNGKTLNVELTFTMK